MLTLRVYQVDAFTRTRFTGNPAGVVANAEGLTASQMQAIARELNNSETAFILPPEADDHAVCIRFFTPTMEVPTCGHATISAHYVRAKELDLPTTTVHQHIGIGTLPVEVVRDGDDYRIVMTQGRPEFLERIEDEARTLLLSALGLDASDLDERCPIEHVSTGASKILVGVTSRSCLHALKPDLKQLVDLNEMIPYRGCFVFTLDSEEPGIVSHCRMFAPQIGIAEDPVTGNGNGPLGAYLVRHGLLQHDGKRASFSSKQGEAIGRPGVAHVEVDLEAGQPVRVCVGGDAVIAFETTIVV